MSGGSRRERLKSELRQRTAELKRRQRSWALLGRPEGRHRYFAPPDGVGDFDVTLTTQSLSQAWWLGELCRFVYTADHREQDREAHVVDRVAHLEGSPFRQVADVHRYGTHVALFHVGAAGEPQGAVLCFRGTTRFRQWVLNLSPLPVLWKGDEQAGGRLSNRAWVHQGFSVLFENLWPKIEPHLEGVPEPLILTGHSLGAALALQASSRCRASSLYTFGSPRVGERRFCEGLGGVDHYRFVNGADVVPLLPETGADGTPFAFCHHGEEIRVGVPADPAEDPFSTSEDELDERLKDEGSSSPERARRSGTEGEKSALQLRLEQSFRQPGLPPAFRDHLMSSYLRSIRRILAGDAKV